MAAAVVSDTSISAGRQEEHLIFERIRRERPAMSQHMVLALLDERKAGAFFQTLRVVVNRFASARIQSMNVLAPGKSLARVGQTSQ